MLVFAVLAASSAVVASAEASSALVPPEESVAGLRQDEWSREWWQWAGSFSGDASPIADRTGRLCHSKQSGAVFFLAGTYGTQRTVRKCTVPAGTYLFFPLINYVTYPGYKNSLDCDQASRSTTAATDNPSALVLELDGRIFKNLAAHRQATRGCFDLAARAGGGITPSAANGYYIMLRPLSRGTHTLNFGGILPTMTQAVTYELIVE
jgi:hypothetical protein